MPHIPTDTPGIFAQALAEQLRRDHIRHWHIRETRYSMTTWQWPEGVAVMIHHWTWADGADYGMPNLISGWSTSSEVDQNDYIHLEAEYADDALLAPQTAWVNPAGLPTRRAHTFRSTADLPPELLDPDGLPVVWLRALVEAKAARWGIA